jgi:YVTN family beta-propeller protein
MSLLTKFSIKVFTLSLLAAMVGFTQLHAQTVAYVTNAFGNNVSVLDVSTNTVTATIPVGPNPTGVVFSPDGTRAYVTNGFFSSGTVSVIDTASNSVVATISVGGLPGYPAVTPDGANLYVPANGSMAVVSTATNSVVASIPTAPLGTAVAITADGTRAYVLGLNAVSVVDITTNTVVQTIPVSSLEPEASMAGIAITPGGGSVYVSGGNDSVVTVISTASNTVVATIPVSVGSGSLGITPDGSRVYVSELFSGFIRVIDTATNTLEPVSIPVGGIFAFPIGLAVTPDGASVYVTNGFINTISVIDTTSNTVVATLPAGNGPFGVAIFNMSTPFSLFSVKGLTVNSHGFTEAGNFTLSANSAGIDLANQPLTITVDSFSLTIPAGSFKQVGGNMHFVFSGTINGLSVSMTMSATKGSSTVFSYSVTVTGVDLTAQPNPATVTLKIGENTGTTTAPF